MFSATLFRPSSLSLCGYKFLKARCVPDHPLHCVRPLRTSAQSMEFYFAIYYFLTITTVYLK